MTPRELEEYRTLRNTIRQRGTARVWMFLAGLAIWAALTVGAEMNLESELDQVAADLGEELRVSAESYHVPMEYVVRAGDPVTEIVRIADEVKVDAVVVGASTQAGHRLVGSVAVRLVRMGRWPVTVVP